MRLTISVSNPRSDQDGSELLSLEMSSSMTIGNLKSLVEPDINAPPALQALFYNGQPLADDSKTLEDIGITDGDMLALQIRPPPGSAAARPSRRPNQQQQQSLDRDPEIIRLAVAGDPAARSHLQDQNPELAAAIDDPVRWRTLYLEMKRREAENTAAQQREMEALNADPFNEDAQRRIAEIIRQNQVMENLQNAMENNPESFGKVNMLYIDVEVNGHPVKAFVDSGAQATILSPSCAERCNVMWLVDSRFAGTAYGVGTAKVLGRVHSAQIKIGNLHLPCSFTVMEGKEVELLLGLDMLKRHQACIDLKQNKLILAGTEVPFLSEADSPKYEEQRRREPQIEGPAGTVIGARSGALSIQSGSGNQPGPSSSSSSAPAPAQSLPARQAAQAAAQRQQTQAQPQLQPGQATQAASQARGPGARAPHPEEKITQLTSLGFTRARAIAALDSTNGEVEFAAGLLFDEA